MKDVVKADELKLLIAGIISPITDNKWVCPTKVVPKKSRIIVVKNSDEKMIPTCIFTSWYMCIDYRKLNQVMQKDHFSIAISQPSARWVAGH